MIATNLDEQAIFEVARKIDSRETREAYLQQVCGDKVAIGLRVRALLKAYEESASFLESPAVPLVTLDEPIAERPGTVIGSYKLLEQIGEGGMGLVFMAEQSRPVRRRVALKVIKPGMDTRHIVARFEAERQALALMDHPNIAKIHDGGSTDSGRPYFVMELVRGVPITDFCDQRRLTTRQRLELFVTVCQAVQHAHQKGIIHRDLKPSNVLVTLHDTVAVPKIIDFGIAKATTQPLTDRTLFTNFAQMIGTPMYMSPEQAEMNGLDVDTRSDVYALGVLLYELLTGTTPFQSQTLKKMGLDELRRMIREEEPQTPSQRLSTLAPQLCSTVSERRGVDGRRLEQVLRRELDWVVMKALEKDRNRRYESASALAADVQRYQNDEAVAACPPSACYRLRKYVRRNRRALAMATIIAAALMSATLVSTWQVVVARDALGQAEATRKDAEADRDRARNAETQAKAAEKRVEMEAAIARAVNDFLQNDLLRQVNNLPKDSDQLNVNERLTVREALDRAAARIGDRFKGQPRVEAAVRMAIGESYTSLALYLLARPHFERAVALRCANLGSDHPDTLASKKSLIENYCMSGRSRDAIIPTEEALSISERTFGPDHPNTFDASVRLANVYRAAEMFDRAIPLTKQVLDKRMATLGPNDVATLDTMHLLARCFLTAGSFEESIFWHEKLLSVSRGDDIFRLRTYSRALQGVGRFEDADRQLCKALELARNISDPRSKEVETAHVQNILAPNLLFQGRYKEAEQAARNGLAAWKKGRPGDWSQFHLMSVIGGALLGQRKIAEAEPFLIQGYAGLKEHEAIKNSGFDHWVVQAAERLIRYYEMTNQSEKARQVREENNLRRSRIYKVP
jgi:serine/threonine protein kinase